MRIAVPVTGEAVSAGLAACTEVKLYEDDHGRITKRAAVPVTAGESALEIIERRGVDVLICGELPDAERRELAASGLLLAQAQAADAEAAALAYLGAAIACDPSNNCNYCGFKDECGKVKQA